MSRLAASTTSPSNSLTDKLAPNALASWAYGPVANARACSSESNS